MTLSPDPDISARLRALEAENADLRARLASAQDDALDQRARLSAAQDRALSIAFEREEAMSLAAKARRARDREEARLAVYVRELDLSAPVIHRLDGSALGVERVRRRALRREAA